MTKDITFRTIEKLGCRITFNYQETISGGGGETEAYYYPVAMDWHCIAEGNGSANRRLSRLLLLGAARTTQYTPAEIYTKVESSLGTNVANEIKELYLEALNEDISL